MPVSIFYSGTIAIRNHKIWCWYPAGLWHTWHEMEVQRQQSQRTVVNPRVFLFQLFIQPAPVRKLVVKASLMSDCEGATQITELFYAASSASCSFSSSLSLPQPLTADVYISGLLPAGRDQLSVSSEVVGGQVSANRLAVNIRNRDNIFCQL